MTPAARKAAQQAEAQRQAEADMRARILWNVSQRHPVIMDYLKASEAADRLGPGPDRPVVQAN